MRKANRQTMILAAVVGLLGLIALFKIFGNEVEIEPELGSLIIWAGILEILHSFQRATIELRKMAWKSAGLSILIGILLINAPLLVSQGLVILIGLSFLADALMYIRHAIKATDPAIRRKGMMAAAGNFAIVILILLFQRKGITATLSIVIALRIFGTALNMLSAPTGTMKDVSEDILKSMSISGNTELSGIAEDIEQEEARKAPYDRYWITAFILILFFIHLGRMGFDRSTFGILSPLLATIGDCVIALIITYVIIGPILLGFRWISEPIEKALWKWVLSIPKESRKKISLRTLVETGLETRLSARIRLRKSGYSIFTAIRTGLKLGLPWAALLVAVMPVLGMSWYFDTENWASGVWDTWAAKRTDIWRENMARATGIEPSGNAFNLQPAGVSDSGDYSFVVIGDPGEGDASQLILKDRILRVTEKPDVKFVVISSDVIYPSGAMKDYEKKFYLPFKGITKPVYAIPGNHDWYDALEGFAANFYTPEMARKTMRARVGKDLNISTTTDERIEEMIRRADFLRNNYGVPTGFQAAPYFQVSQGDFVLLCVDTGVKRQLDSLELAWLRAALEKSRGKFVMALLGHPFYAIGEYQGNMNPEFNKLHELLREYQVPVVMAGDTHDFEYYRETTPGNDAYVMHHFVNGGGGAYLSIGTAMANLKDMPTKEFAFYPSHDPLVKKIEDNTSWYKYPAWWYTRKFNGWPFSAEWLSAAFDYNVAPFFQSFMEIRVERSANRVRFIAYSQNGPLRWKDISSTAGARPAGADMNGPAEWILPLRK